MTIAGTLEDMSLPTLVQSLLQEGAVAQIRVADGVETGWVYLDGRQIAHAAIAADEAAEEMRLEGEPAVFELLRWQTGRFWLEKHIPAPRVTVEQSWDFLLMEGLRQLDEDQASTAGPELPVDPAAAFDNLTEEEAAVLQTIAAPKEATDQMASKSEELNRILTNIVGNSNDILGAVIVDNDGLLLASVLNGNQDGNRVAAVSAGLVSLAGRSASQLQQGGVRQTLIQAERGNIIAIRAGEKASLVALTGSGSNLGMVFLETQDAAAEIRSAL